MLMLFLFHLLDLLLIYYNIIVLQILERFITHPVFMTPLKSNSVQGTLLVLLTLSHLKDLYQNRSVLVIHN